MTAPRAIALTRKGYLILDLLDSRDGSPLRPGFGPCSGCGETCAIWDGVVVCMTRADGGRCHGNGQAPRRADA